MHKVLADCLVGLSLPRKSVVRLTDRPDMTLDVYHGLKPPTQQQLYEALVIPSAIGVIPMQKKKKKKKKKVVHI